MQIETNEALDAGLERLNAAASLLERMATQLGQSRSAEGELGKITAEVDQEAIRESAVTEREMELERRLARAEQQIAEMRAQENKTVTSRKTLPAATAQLLAKQGIASVESIEAGALDAALAGLSLEQRIAVKSQLLRAGIVS